MRILSRHAVLGLAGVAALAAACRSSSNITVTESTAPPAPTATAAPEPTPPPTPAPTTAAEAEPPAAETAAADEEAEAPGAPASIQKEALDLCQAGQEAVKRGELEQALVSADRAYELMLTLPSTGDHLQAKEDIRVLAADLIGRIYRARRASGGTPSASWDLGIQILTNDHVQREIESFLGPERDAFVEAYRRSGLYRPMMIAKLKEAGLPTQLSWLPLVESAFKTRALSRASALGLWQFISSTGLRYGLSRDPWVDERLDPEKATDGAVAYLADLHGFFGDWPKALAAYNCGEARVMRLSRQSSDYMDFWDLYALLPGETRRYVPRLFAALQIIESPAKYGITLPEPETPRNGTARVRVERSVSLERLDAALGLETGTLAELNPELRYKATPKDAYDLRVPGGREEDVTTQVALLPEHKPPRPEFVMHRVKAGETLSTIASRYGTSASAIMRANNLRSHLIRAGQRLRIPGRAR